jgi:flagellar basal body-associated protein FliL
LKREIVPQAESKGKGLLIFYRVVMAVVVVLVLVLAAGSLYALVRPAASEPLFRIGDGAAGRGSARRAAPGTADGETAVFSGIRGFRIPVSGQPPSTLILSVSFPYPVNDRAFTEELASRISDFRTIVTDYFSVLSAEAIGRMDEEAAKADILRKFNALLRLGKIETLYFSDLMIVR